MQRLLDHADFVLVASALLALFASSVVASALGAGAHPVTLVTFVMIAVLHGGLHLAIQRFRHAERRECKEPDTLGHPAL